MIVKLEDKSDLIRKYRARKAVEYLNRETNRLLFYIVSSISAIVLTYALLRFIYGN